MDSSWCLLSVSKRGGKLVINFYASFYLAMNETSRKSWCWLSKLKEKWEMVSTVSSAWYKKERRTKLFMKIWTSTIDKVWGWGWIKLSENIYWVTLCCCHWWFFITIAADDVLRERSRSAFTAFNDAYGRKVVSFIFLHSNVECFPLIVLHKSNVFGSWWMEHLIRFSKLEGWCEEANFHVLMIFGFSYHSNFVLSRTFPSFSILILVFWVRNF